MQVKEAIYNRRAIKQFDADHRMAAGCANACERPLVRRPVSERSVARRSPQRVSY